MKPRIYVETTVPSFYHEVPSLVTPLELLGEAESHPDSTISGGNAHGPPRVEPAPLEKVRQVEIRVAPNYAENRAAPPHDQKIHRMTRKPQVGVAA